MNDAPQDMPLQPEPGETIVWGAVREAVEPIAIPPLVKRAGWLVNTVLTVFGLVTAFLTLRSRYTELLDYVPYVVIGGIGFLLATLLAPGRNSRVGRWLSSFKDRHVTPRATAHWLSDARIIVEPSDHPDTDFAMPLGGLSDPRLDYHMGERCVVVDWERGPIILRTTDAQGLLAALRARLG